MANGLTEDEARRRRADKRPTLAVFRHDVLSGQGFSRAKIASEADRAHDRLRDEALRALFGAVNDKATGTFVLFEGKSQLMVTHDSAERALREVFDRRKRKAR